MPRTIQSLADECRTSRPTIKARAEYLGISPLKTKTSVHHKEAVQYSDFDAELIIGNLKEVPPERGPVSKSRMAEKQKK